MLTKEYWLSFLRKTLNKPTVKFLAKKASSDKDAIGNLIDLSFYPDSQIAFRAAWVLEYTVLYSEDGFILQLPHFLDAYPKQRNRSCQRHFTKILMLLMSHNRDSLNNYDLEPVIETTFEWLINYNTPVAVQVNCMSILYYLKSQYTWVEDELRSQIVFLMKEGTAALQSRGNKLLKKLE